MLMDVLLGAAGALSLAGVFSTLVLYRKNGNGHVAEPPLAPQP